MLKSAAWEYKPRQLCQGWGALPEQGRAQQFLKEQPVWGCYWANPAPASSPWAAAGLQVESCGGKRETRELPDWWAGSAVLFKVLNQSFTWRGVQQGMAHGWQVPAGALGLAYLRGWHTALPGWFLGLCREWTSPSELSVPVLVVWPLPTREGSFEQISSNLEIMKFSIRPGC